uniref:Uncharacterized protein n=1 Tax=Oryza glumipatula TaxID=40148 RepID=A0A0E0AGF1_9ORYZ
MERKPSEYRRQLLRARSVETSCRRVAVAYCTLRRNPNRRRRRHSLLTPIREIFFGSTCVAFCVEDEPIDVDEEHLYEVDDTVCIKDATIPYVIATQDGPTVVSQTSQEHVTSSQPLRVNAPITTQPIPRCTPPRQAKQRAALRAATLRATVSRGKRNLLDTVIDP